MLSCRDKMSGCRRKPLGTISYLVLIIYIGLACVSPVKAENGGQTEQYAGTNTDPISQDENNLPESQEVFDFFSRTLQELQQSPEGNRSSLSMTYGSPVNQIGTFNGLCVWLGWVGSFSETYIPESENYAWVVYFAPEGVYVALQNSCSRYSAVDVFAGIGSFFGAISAPDGTDRNFISKDYLESLLGVMVTLNISAGVPVAGPLSQLGVGKAPVKAGMR
jgi:hypothetical protein